jgi:AcrR family transcriptional regulator
MRKRNLNKDQISDFAFQYSIKNGWQSLNLKLIAEHFEIKTPSLYNHIENLDELILELAAITLEELGKSLAKSIQGISGAEAINELSQAYRKFAKSHRGVYDLTIQAPSGHARHEKASIELLEILFSVLRNKSKKEKIHNIRILRSSLHGFVSIELGKGFGLPTDIEETFKRMIKILVLQMEL